MFERLALKHKLLVLEGLSFGMFLIMAVFGLVQLNNTVNDNNANIKRLSTDIVALNQINSMNVAFLKQVKLAKDVWIRGSDHEKLAKYRGEYLEQSEIFEKSRVDAIEELSALAVGHPEVESFIDQLKTIADEHQSVSAKYLSQIDAHTNVSESDAKVAGIDRALTKQVTELRDNVSKFASEKSLEKITLSNQGFQQRLYFVLIWIGFALALSVFVATIVIRSILKQLGGEPSVAVNVALEVAQGNLMVSVPDAPTDSLMSALGKMRNDLKVTISAFASGIEKTRDSATELLMSADTIYANTSAQADSTSSIAATVEEVSATLKSISNSAESARELSSQTGEEAAHGGALIQNVASDVKALSSHAAGVSAVVSELEQSQNNVAKIVKVIAEIADQTNLLALNAAIEAARAGEAGRGFAVVADEVRKLSERTGQSTREIRTMIEAMHNGTSAATGKISQMLSSVDESVERALIAEQAIAKIIDIANRSNYAVNDISAALQEQSQAMNDISQKIELIAESSEMNRTKVQQLTVSAHKMNEVASDLTHQIKRFRTQGGDGVDLF